MQPLFDSFAKAIRSVFAPGMFMLFVKCVLLTLAALVGFVLLVSSLGGMLYGIYGPAEGMALGVAGSSLIATLIAWFLFPGIMPLFVNFFDVKIMRIIEREDYPATPSPTEPPFWPEIWHDAHFTLKAVLLNLLALPLYFLPLINIAVFYWLNGYLLGREFFSACARRHIGIANAEMLRKKHARIITLGGAALVFCATIPFVNLVAPFWGVALMTHLYHALTGSKKSEILLP